MEQWEHEMLDYASWERQQNHLWGPPDSWGHVSYYGEKRPAVTDKIDVMFITLRGDIKIATEHVMRSYRARVVCRPYKPRERTP